MIGNAPIVLISWTRFRWVSLSQLSSHVALLASTDAVHEHLFRIRERLEKQLGCLFSGKKHKY